MKVILAAQIIVLIAGANANDWMKSMGGGKGENIGKTPVGEANVERKSLAAGPRAHGLP